MTLRRLKQQIGFEAARHGSHRLLVDMDGLLVEVPLDANVRVYARARVVYIGVPKAQSALLVLEDGALRPAREDEADAIQGRVEPLMIEERVAPPTDAMAKLEAAVREATASLPPGWRVKVDGSGSISVVRDAQALVSAAIGDLNNLSVNGNENEATVDERKPARARRSTPS